MYTKKWPDWYVYMENNKIGNVRGQNGDPGAKGHWKISVAPGSTPENLLLRFSPKQWPNWFMCMDTDSTGNIIGSNGDPGPRGYWKLTDKEKTKVGDVDFEVFALSPKQWPDWYAYMVNDSQANLRGWNGDPGEQGYFMMKKIPK